MTETAWPPLLAQLLSGTSLTADQSAWAMEQIMQGRATGSQFGALVAGLRSKSETAQEMLGLVTAMRAFSQRVQVDGPLLDTCGTGGDRAGTINVSTLAALVAAGAGAKVAKHGNRAASSHCGSADLLEELGVRIDLGPEGVKACIDEAGIGFCFAPIFHPGMRHAAPFRKELGVPTIFNFLGPLTNPAGATHQAIGVSDPEMAPKMLEVLEKLGAEHVLIFNSFDGLDEISVSAPSTLWELKGGQVDECIVDPLDLGIPRAEMSSIQGGSVEENARIALAVLGGETGPGHDVVLINAAAGIIAGDLESGFPEALERAADSIESGRAKGALDRLREVSNKAGG